MQGPGGWEGSQGRELQQWGRRVLSSVVATAAPGGLVWPRLDHWHARGSLWRGGACGPTLLHLGGRAGTGLGAHSILAFSVMVGPTSAWASGGYMDPEGVLTCGRE